MVVINTQSNLSSAPSCLDLSFENLTISSATDDLGVSDEAMYLHSHSSVKPEDEFRKSYESPFLVWYANDEVWPNCHARTPKHWYDSADSFEDAISDSLEDASSNEESPDFDRSSPTSPTNIPSHKERGSQPSPLTKRESLLEEAWERKRELYLHQELANLQEHANVGTLGRSASDCGNPMRDIWDHTKNEHLRRSMSDCRKGKKDPCITPKRLRRTLTRSLTDDDFEELKGCLDLGFRFDQSSIPELCDTLPALEAVCAVTHNFQESLIASPIQSLMPSPTSSWRITSPGDDPEDVKEKLRHWAQAVACSARLCY